MAARSGSNTTPLPPLSRGRNLPLLPKPSPSIPVAVVRDAGTQPSPSLAVFGPRQLSPETREKTARVRKLGACIRCRMLKYRVSSTEYTPASPHSGLRTASNFPPLPRIARSALFRRSFSLLFVASHQKISLTKLNSTHFSLTIDQVRRDHALPKMPGHRPVPLLQTFFGRLESCSTQGRPISQR
jgi:hypothetical protein